MFPDKDGEDDDELVEGADGILRPRKEAEKKKQADGKNVSGMLDTLQQQLKKQGIRGDEMIKQKQKELEEEDRRLEELKEKAEQAAKEKAANMPTSAADAKARANAFFGAGKVAAAAEMYEKALELLEEEEEERARSSSDGGGKGDASSVASSDAEGSVVATGTPVGETPQRADKRRPRNGWRCQSELCSS